MNKLKQIYKLSDIKYPWIILASMIMFLMSLCIHSIFRENFSSIEVWSYGLCVFVAIVWSMLNYFSHLNLNRLFKKYDSIDAFVENMSMDETEKAEFAQYLQDFAKDLEENGEPHDEAVKKAISHFQVSEFLELKGGDMFEKPAHYYLLGFASVMIAMAVILQVMASVLQIPFILSALCFSLVLYGIAFFNLFFLYKILDKLLSQKH